MLSLVVPDFNTCVDYRRVLKTVEQRGGKEGTERRGSREREGEAEREKEEQRERRERGREEGAGEERKRRL